MRLHFDFVIIGAMKAGTTTLDSFLRAHPQTYLLPTYFGQRIDLHGSEAKPAFKDWAALELEKAGTDGKRIGHTRANYFVNASAMEEIVASRSTRVIFVYRDPIDRLWSHYNHELRKGRTFRTFRSWLTSDEGKRGIAYSQYERNLSTHASELASRLKVLHMRETSDPESMRLLCTFLDLDPVEARRSPANVGGVPWSPFLNFAGSKLTRMIYPEPCRRSQRLDKMRSKLFTSRGKKIIMPPEDAKRAADLIGDELSRFHDFLARHPKIKLKDHSEA